MFGALKSKTIKILNWFHIRIFGAEMGGGTRTFAKNIGYTVLGNLGTTAFLFIVNIVAVRTLGPTEYGKYILILSVVNFLTIPMLMGMHTSAMKYLPEHKDPADRAEIISTSFWAVIVFTLVLSVIFYFSGPFLSSILGLPVLIFLSAILYSILLSIEGISGAILKGLHAFRKLAIFGVINAATIFITFFILFFFWEDRTYKLYIYSILAGLLAFSAIVITQNIKNLSLSLFNMNKLKLLLKYGILGISTSFSWFIITTVDRFMLNKFTNTEAVGIYAVYIGTSSIIIGRFFSLFLTVFFPTVAGVTYKLEINKKINKLIKIGAIPYLVINCLLIFIMFKIYGADYPFNLFLALMFSVSVMLYNILHLKWNLLNSSGAKLLSIFSKYSFVGAVVSLVLNYFLINQFGIYGALFTSLFIYTCLFILADVNMKHFVQIK